MTYFFAPVARTFAIASLTGAALLAGSVAPTWAQTTDSKDSKTPPAAAAATSTKAETVEQRIVTLKAALKVTPEQEYDNRYNNSNDWNNRYYGYHYRQPPVVYSTPYNYGYQPPPVIYDNTPGFTIRIQ
jgi:hypothetical protein